MKINQLIKIFGSTMFCLLLIISFGFEISAQKKAPAKSKVTEDRDLTKPTEKKEKPIENSPRKEQPIEKSDSSTRKKIIVVLDFTDDTFGTKKIEVGRQIATFLANEFSKNGTYTVIERQQIAQILKEQDLTFGERFDPKTAAKVGKALSANPVVLGSITEYTAGNSGVSIMGVGKIKITAKIGLAIRLVDVNTGEILKAETVEGKASKSGVNAGVYKNGRIEDEDLKTSLFTQAANNAIISAVQKLSPTIDETKNFALSEKENIKTAPQKNTQTSQSNTENTLTRAISMPKVAAIIAENILISGLAKNIKIGDRFKIMRGTEIKDPDTGETIDFDGKEIAVVEVIEIRAQTVKAKIVKGVGIKVKDIVQAIK